MTGTLERFQMMLRCPATHIINHVPADVTVHARRDLKFREAVSRADLNVPDGMGVVWGCRALGYPNVRERVYGPDFMRLAIEWGMSFGLTHYLLGGTDRVLTQLMEKLSTKHPEITIVGAYSPPFRPLTGKDIAEIADHINEKCPDVVWVGLGTPKQQFVAAQLRPLVDVHVLVTVGAAFDFLAGAKRQAPVWMQTRGLEWLFRLLTEPRRLAVRYLVGNPQFILGVLSDIRSRRPGA